MARDGFSAIRLWMGRLAMAWQAVALFSALAMSYPVWAQEAAQKAAAQKEEAQKEGVGEKPAAGVVDPAEAPAKASAQDPADPAVAAANAACEAKLSEWRNVIMQLRQLRTDYQTADDAQRATMAAQWKETVAKGEALLPGLIDAVLAAYEASPNTDRVKTVFLAKVLHDFIARDEYEPALKVGRVLANHECDLPDVFRDAGIAAFTLNDYDVATRLLDTADKLGALGGDALILRQELEQCKANWEVERQLRAKEAEADDLPRVKLTTNKGDIVVELFENEAPETVANFISLVKKGHYDSLTFHRVLSGFMAQGGCPVGDGTGGPGYAIYDECTKPGFRKHFYGVLSMAKTIAPNSGGSQFFIAYRPLPHLDGKHTVFGRVIEGMDVVVKLQRRNPPDEENLPEPDRIVKAEVIRDRGHEYKPHIVE